MNTVKLLFAAAAAKSLQSCPTLCDPKDALTGLIFQIRHDFFFRTTTSMAVFKSIIRHFTLNSVSPSCNFQPSGNLVQKLETKW